MDGVCDLGFIGENVLEEVSLQRQLDNETYDYTVLARLDFGGCRLSIAVPQEENYQGVQRFRRPAPLPPLTHVY